MKIVQSVDLAWKNRSKKQRRLLLYRLGIKGDNLAIFSSKEWMGLPTEILNELKFYWNGVRFFMPKNRKKTRKHSHTVQHKLNIPLIFNPETFTIKNHATAKTSTHSRRIWSMFSS